MAGLPATSDWSEEARQFSGFFPETVSLQDTGAIGSLTTRWASVDPEAAFAWLLMRPEIQSRPSEGNRILSAWLNAEPTTAADWLAEHTPAGMARDEMLTSLVVMESSGKPEATRAALALIQDDAARDAAVRTALKEARQSVEVLRVWEASPLLPPQVTAEMSKVLALELTPSLSLDLPGEIQFHGRQQEFGFSGPGGFSAPR